STMPRVAELVSLQDAARRLGVSVRTLQRRIRAGEIPVERVATSRGQRVMVQLKEGMGAAEAPAGADDSSLTDTLRDVRAERNRLWDLVREQQRTIVEQQETIAQLVRQAANAQVLIGQAQRIAQLPAAGSDSTATPDAPAARQGATASGMSTEASQRP